MTPSKKIVGAVLLLAALSARPAAAVLVVEATFAAQGSLAAAPAPSNLGGVCPGDTRFPNICPLRRAVSDHSQWLQGADFAGFSGSGLSSGPATPLPLMGSGTFIGLEHETPGSFLRIPCTAWIAGFSVSRIFRPPKAL